MGREFKKWSVVMLKIVIVAIILRASTAQVSVSDGCWRRFLDCETNCCTVINELVSDERPCFCTIKEVIGNNATRELTLNRLLSTCGQSAPLDTLCPDTIASPSDTISPPSPGSDSSLPPLVPPTAPTSTNPIETPTLAPSTDVPGDCWLRIANCANTTTTITECCPLIKQEIANERECFCLIQDHIRENPSFATTISLLFTTCTIPGSIDTVCPGPGLTPSSETSLPTPPPPPVSPTSPSEFVIPPPGPPPPPAAATNSSDINQSGSSKIVVTFGLLLPRALLLIICAILVS